MRVRLHRTGQFDYSTTRRAWYSYSYGTAALLLGHGALAFAAAPGFGARGALLVLGAAVVLLTFAERLQVGASWTLSFDLAPERSRSAYLVLFNTSRTVANRVAGPVLMTGVVLALGTVGWIALACVLLLGALVPFAMLRGPGGTGGRHVLDAPTVPPHRPTAPPARRPTAPPARRYGAVAGPRRHSTRTQSRVRSTARFQSAYPAARRSSLHCGSQRFASCQCSRNSP